RATGVFAGVLAVCLTAACGVTDDDPERTRLAPLHGTIDPDVLAAPVAIPVAVPESSVAVGQWRVAEVVDGRTLLVYRGLERATAVLGGISVPVDDECMAGRAVDSLTFITGGGRAVSIRPPTPRQDRIDDARILTADGEDVAASLLSLGLARIDGESVPPDDYVEAEQTARQQAVGVWSGDCHDG
ncbi:thermonuclease family protein, partial [Ilumatobacter sp.]|uniref:thermonuclease family protein n=1 Tax=Ilumatobacter sp. TaxID=1967498 RepID=UPI003AF520BE